MRALVISGYGIKVSFQKGALMVKSRQGSSTYSLADIDQVILATSGISITSKAIRALSNAGIDLVVLDSRGFPVSILYHPFLTRTVMTRRMQYESFNNEKGVEIAKIFAYSKILNQAGLLKRGARLYGISTLREDIGEIASLAEKVRKIRGERALEVASHIRQIEAFAARIYWGAYSSLLPRELGFNGRDQDGEDLVNKVLNYGYGVMYRVCWKAVSLAGLDPYAGFIHTDRSGKPVLVFDFIEGFRSPSVDYALLKLFKGGWRPKMEGKLLSPEARVKIIEAVKEGLKRKFRRGSTVKTLESWITSYAWELARYLRGDGKLKPIVFRW